MSKVSLVDLQSFMALRRKSGLTFPHPIEQQYVADTGVRRCQRLTGGILVTALVYNLFLFADWLLVPDVFWQAVVLHAIITPFMIATAWFISKRPTPWLRESLAAVLPLLMTLQIQYCFATTASDGAAHYQYVLVSNILYANVSLHRLIFPFALAVSMTIVIIHAGLVTFLDVLPGSVSVIIVVLLSVCAYMTLVANYQMERDVRRAYLYSLRDRLLHANADEASRRDALTGLGNRHHLEGVLQKLWASKDLGLVSVIMIDIDHFKRLNDRYGHAAGDICLKRVAAIVISELRGGRDHAIRYGGEELLVVLPEMQLIDAMRVAERIRGAIEKAAIPNEEAPPRGVVTASLGVAASSITELTSVELIAAADSALYAAKHKGRNQVWPRIAGSGTIVGLPVRRNASVTGKTASDAS